MHFTMSVACSILNWLKLKRKCGKVVEYEAYERLTAWKYKERTGHIDAAADCGEYSTAVL